MFKPCVSIFARDLEIKLQIYRKIKESFEALGIHRHCSEFHGMIIGMMSSKGSKFSSDELNIWLEAYLGRSLSSGLAFLIKAVLEQGVESLGEYSNFEFEIALPYEESPLNEQVIALSAWCAGFVAAAEKCGVISDTSGNAIIKETIRDFRRISEISEDIGESDENESDYTQLREFARVGALTVYSEMRSKKI